MLDSRWKDAPRRLLTAFVGVPLVLGITIGGSPLFEMTLLAMAVLVSVEITHIVRPRGGVLLTLALVLVWFNAYYTGLVVPLLVIAALLVWWRRSALLLLAAYVGMPLALMIGVRVEGAEWVLLLLVTNWVTDTFALIGGRTVGRYKLAPRTSPGKTYEGAIIGYVCGFSAGAVLALALDLPLGASLPVITYIPIATIIGDLVVSALKRRFDVKDSGGLLPGHGGLLDRLDGLMPATAIVALLLYLIP